MSMKRRICLFAFALLAVVFYHGIFICTYRDPIEYTVQTDSFDEKSEVVLDRAVCGDAYLVLMRNKDMENQLLIFQKNIVIPRWQLLEKKTLSRQHDQSRIAIRTTKALFSVEIDDNRISITSVDNEYPIQIAPIMETYLLPSMLFFAGEMMLWHIKQRASK